MFPYIGNFIIPIDFHFFQRGGPTTNQQNTLETTKPTDATYAKPSGHRFQVAAREQRLKFLENLDVASRFLQVMDLADLADLALQLSVYPVAIYGWFMVGLWLVTNWQYFFLLKTIRDYPRSERGIHKKKQPVMA